MWLIRLTKQENGIEECANSTFVFVFSLALSLSPSLYSENEIRHEIKSNRNQLKLNSSVVHCVLFFVSSDHFVGKREFEEGEEGKCIYTYSCLHLTRNLRFLYSLQYILLFWHECVCIFIKLLTKIVLFMFFYICVHLLQLIYLYIIVSPLN